MVVLMVMTKKIFRIYHDFTTLHLPHHLNQNLDESLSYLPAEDAGVLLLVLVYLVFNLGGDFSKIFYIYSKNAIMEYY